MINLDDLTENIRECVYERDEKGIGQPFTLRKLVGVLRGQGSVVSEDTYRLESLSEYRQRLQSFGM